MNTLPCGLYPGDFIFLDAPSDAGRLAVVVGERPLERELQKAGKEGWAQIACRHLCSRAIAALRESEEDVKRRNDCYSANAKLSEERDDLRAERDGLRAAIGKASKAIENFNFIIELVENRCMAADGPVTPTLQEMEEAELRDLWLQVQQISKALDEKEGG